MYTKNIMRLAIAWLYLTIATVSTQAQVSAVQNDKEAVLDTIARSTTLTGWLMS